MITLNQVTLRRGLSVLLNQVNWTIYHKQHIGIIGANGTGKSSLFAMLLGELSADEGELEFPKQLTLAHVAQETISSTITALDFVLEGDNELQVVLSDLKKAEDTHDGSRIA